MDPVRSGTCGSCTPDGPSLTQRPWTWCLLFPEVRPCAGRFGVPSSLRSAQYSAARMEHGRGICPSTTVGRAAYTSWPLSGAPCTLTGPFCVDARLRVSRARTEERHCRVPLNRLVQPAARGLSRRPARVRKLPYSTGTMHGTFWGLAPQLSSVCFSVGPKTVLPAGRPGGPEVRPPELKL